MPETITLLLAGVAAGALNAAGGGGTFVALPVLVAAGLPPVVANASSTVALLPGALASAWTLRGGLVPVGPVRTRWLTAASVLGGLLGAGLLLVLPAASFGAAVPWLLAFATATLAFGRPLAGRIRAAVGRPLAIGPRGLLAGQVVLGAYGGYFGGAVGIMMLAFWAVGLGIDPATGNPARVAQLTAVYGVSAAFFLAASDVLRYPLPVAAMLVGAVGGGIAGARLARRLPGPVLRAVVLVVAVTMTVLYAVRGG